MVTYRTKDGAHYFRFAFVQIGDRTWRAYILAAPSYGRRSEDLHSTHRYYDPDQNLHFICFEPPPRTLADMRSVTKAWAEHTQEYIRTGVPFEHQ